MRTTKLRGVIAALAIACTAAVAAAPAQAGNGTLSNGICWSSFTQSGSFGGEDGSRRISLRCRPRVFGDYVATKYNVRFPGFSGSQNTQFERTDGQGANWFFADPGDDVWVQGCRKRLFTSYCGPWAKLDVPWG